MTKHVSELGFAFVFALLIALASIVISNRLQLVVLEEQVRALREDLDEVTRQGSPITDRRLSLLESYMGVQRAK